MFEELADRGFSDTQLQAVFDLDLVKYRAGLYSTTHSDTRNGINLAGWS